MDKLFDTTPYSVIEEESKRSGYCDWEIDVEDNAFFEGDRVLWSGVKATVVKAWKHKARILTSSFEYHVVPIHELESLTNTIATDQNEKPIFNEGQKVWYEGKEFFLKKLRVSKAKITEQLRCCGAVREFREEFTVELKHLSVTPPVIELADTSAKIPITDQSQNVIGKSSANKIQTGTLGIYINKEREYSDFVFKQFQISTIAVAIIRLIREIETPVTIHHSKTTLPIASKNSKIAI